MPTVLGFDPLFQFMHDDDVVHALALTVTKRPRGVFNVCGPQPLPLSRVIVAAGRTPVPVPEFVLDALMGRFGFPRLPKGALAHIKYPVVVDGKAFVDATGFAPAFDELEAVAAFRQAFPAA